THRHAVAKRRPDRHRVFEADACADSSVHIRIQAANRHGSDHAARTIELALSRKAGNVQVDRLAAASQWQRTQLKALGTTRFIFLSSWFPDSKSLPGRI